MVERMSGVDAVLWNIEQDPHLASMFANLTILDRPPELDRLRRRLVGATELVPRLRQRVAPGPGRLVPPAWQDDPDFDIHYHVRRVAVPAPGGDRDLHDLVTVLAQAPLDRTRPLWVFTVVDGLDGGRGAIVQVVHHTITDGEGGLRMSLAFLDGMREPEEPGRPASARASLASADGAGADGAGPGSDGAGPTDASPATTPGASPAGGPHGLGAGALGTIVDAGRRQLERGHHLLGGTAELLRRPERARDVGAGALESARSLLRQAVVVDPARSRLWTGRSLRRHFDVLRAPLAEAKQVAGTLGGSLNDLFVTAALGGAATYHRAKGVEPGELRVTMPVSTRRERSDRSMTGNAFAPVRVLLAAGIEDPAARFRSTRDRLAEARRERALGLVESLAGLANALPTSALVRLARQQVRTVDFTTSNVRGAPTELFVAGARIMSNHPVGPTGGTAFNLTLLSYAGSLDMGLNVDVGAVADPGLLRRGIEASFAELLAIGERAPVGPSR